MPVVPANTLTAQALDAKFARRQRHYSISFVHQPASLPPTPMRQEPHLAPRSPLAPEPPQAPAQPEGSSATSAAWRAATADATLDDGAHEPAASTPPRHGHLPLAPEPPPAPEPPQAPAQPEESSATFASWRDAAEADLDLDSDAREPHEPAAVTPSRSKHSSRRVLLGTSAAALTCMIAAGAYLTRADWMPVAATTTAAGTDPGKPVAAARDVAALPAPEATTEIPPASQPDPQPPAAPRPALSAASAAAQATPGLRWTAPAPAPASKTAEAGAPPPAPASPAPAGPAEARPVALRGSALPLPSPQRPQMPAPAVITVTAPSAGTTTAPASTPMPPATLPAVEAPPAPEQTATLEAAGVATPNATDQQLTSTLTLVKQIAMLVHDIQDENSKRRAQTDTLQTKADALQTRGDELSKRMDAVAAENTRLHAQVRVLAGRMQSRPVAYQPRPTPEARP